MHCDAQEAEGTQKPTIQWQRVLIHLVKYLRLLSIHIRFHQIHVKFFRETVSRYRKIELKLLEEILQ